MRLRGAPDGVDPMKIIPCARHEACGFNPLTRYLVTQRAVANQENFGRLIVGHFLYHFGHFVER